MTSAPPVLDTTGSFYDLSASSGIADYAYGNPRLEAAIKHSLRSLPRTARTILDIGCGIGASSWEIARHFPSSSILAVDLSPKRIELARLLFPDARLDYQALNILESSSSLPGFDAIVMLDVYEHIAQHDRDQFHRFVRDQLNPGGVWILTCPSIHHQQYLRERNPAGLQPIDEDVTEQDLQSAAASIQGKLASFRNVTIWNTDDYFHAVIIRTGSAESSRSIPRPRLETRKQRLQRVHDRTGIRVTRTGVMLPDRFGPAVCLIQPNRDVYSETFIRNHAERLPACVRMLHTGWFPTRREDDSRLLPVPVALMTKAEARLPGPVRAVNVAVKNRILARYLRSNQIKVVLAEYGPTGACVMDACQDARVPFVVHFHGADAYHFPMLDTYSAAYQRMFSETSAVVAVSHDMEQQLIALGAPREKVHYVPYGVDPKIFQEADPSSEPLFVAVGRFVDKKAPHLSILAFEKVLRRVPSARLVMIGDGELFESCKQLARALRISETVEFAGVRTPAEVAATMRKARAFVQHSLRTTDGDSEGTPVAVLEAGAVGLPVVSTRHAGIKDVVREGETGFLVDEGDIGSMAEYMIRLAENPGLAAGLGRQARQHVLANFSLNESIERLWKILQCAIKTKS